MELFCLKKAPFLFYLSQKADYSASGAHSFRPKPTLNRILKILFCLTPTHFSASNQFFCKEPVLLSCKGLNMRYLAWVL